MCDITETECGSLKVQFVAHLESGLTSLTSDTVSQYSDAFTLHGRSPIQLASSTYSDPITDIAPGKPFREQPVTYRRYLNKRSGQKADLLEYQYASFEWLPSEIEGVGFGDLSEEVNTTNENNIERRMVQLYALGQQMLTNQQCVTVDDSALQNMSGLKIKVGKVYGIKTGSPLNAASVSGPCHVAGPIKEETRTSEMQVKYILRCMFGSSAVLSSYF